MRRVLFFGLVVVLGGGLLAAAAVFLYGKQRFEAPGPLTAEAVVVIEPGLGLAAIAQRLEAEGVITDALIFRIGTRALDKARALKAGEYAFPAGVSMAAAVELLESGRTVMHRLTVPEGLTSFEVVALVEAAAALSGEIATPPPEGSLLPETYHFTRGEARGEVVGRMQRDLRAVLAELWPQRTEGLPIATPEEAIILASIVEKETGVASERAKVASVFVNRLNIGMPLQSDPTVVYALTQGRGPLGRALTRKDLAVDNPYNTYKVPSLPPGPIANPGRDSIVAVLHPDTTKFLYFVADGSGGHAFAETLQEHNRNVAKWRKIKKNRTQ
jgi:UPF0755 protein